MSKWTLNEVMSEFFQAPARFLFRKSWRFPRLAISHPRVHELHQPTNFSVDIVKKNKYFLSCNKLKKTQSWSQRKTYCCCEAARLNKFIQVAISDLPLEVDRRALLGFTNRTCCRHNLTCCVASVSVGWA